MFETNYEGLLWIYWCSHPKCLNNKYVLYYMLCILLFDPNNYFVGWKALWDIFANEVMIERKSFSKQNKIWPLKNGSPRYRISCRLPDAKIGSDSQTCVDTFSKLNIYLVLFFSDTHIYCYVCEVIFDFLKGAYFWVGNCNIFFNKLSNARFRFAV